MTRSISGMSAKWLAFTSPNLLESARMMFWAEDSIIAFLFSTMLALMQVMPKLWWTPDTERKALLARWRRMNSTASGEVKL